MSKFYAKSTLSLSRNRPLNSKKRSSGFTLLEILLVVGIISILAGIVIVAINPSKQLATVRNTERRSDIKQIDSAVTQYYIDNFYFPTSITTSLTEICDTGSVASTTTAVDGTACGSLVNLSSLVPNYIVAIPKDPQGAIAFLDKLITPAYAAVGGTGYQIMKSSSNKIITKAAKAELDAFIAIGTTTATTTPAGEPETYTITYSGNSNTGGTAPASQTKTEDVTLVLRTNSGSLVRTSYVFAGWNTLANGSGTTYAVGADFTTNATTTLYAKWTANPTYSVTFDANGGTGSMSDQAIDEGASENLTANSFTRTSYTFAGWATTAGGSVAYADQASYTIGSANVTLYAKWTAVWACGATITDSRDSKVYSTVLIGAQCWMQQNLNVGTKVTGVTTQTNNPSIEKYCYNNDEANCTTYGGLYQWPEMMGYSTTPGIQGICPTGWHIPTDTEYKTLVEGQATPGCESSTNWQCSPAGSHLSNLTLNHDNLSGFTALLAGSSNTAGSFYDLGVTTYLWSSSESGGSAWERHLNSGLASVRRYTYHKAYGFSVRCLKD